MGVPRLLEHILLVSSCFAMELTFPHLEFRVGGSSIALVKMKVKIPKVSTWNMVLPTCRGVSKADGPHVLFLTVNQHSRKSCTRNRSAKSGCIWSFDESSGMIVVTILGS